MRPDSPSPLIPFLVACAGIATYSSMDVPVLIILAGKLGGEGPAAVRGLGRKAAIVWRDGMLPSHRPRE